MTAAVVIAGGGLAGAAAACLLAQGGRRVMVLERAAAPVDKICGAFMSGEARIYLERIGIDVTALGAHRITHLRLVRDATAVVTALPFTGFGLSRMMLDEAVLRRAEDLGADVRRGHAVTAASVGSSISLAVDGLGEIPANTLFLATGKHDLRGARRRPDRAPEDLVGFQVHLRLAPRQHAAQLGHVDVMMFPDGYGGLQLIEGGRSNLCLLVGRHRVQRVGGQWAGVLADLLRTEPHLSERLDGAEWLPDRPATIYRVPYGYLHHPAPNGPVGLFRLGDQAGVIPSFTGDGMAIALHSAALAVATFARGESALDYHRRLRRDIGRQVRLAVAMDRFGRRPAGQDMMMRAARLWPRGMAVMAGLTRIANGRIVREGVG